MSTPVHSETIKIRESIKFRLFRLAMLVVTLALLLASNLWTPLVLVFGLIVGSATVVGGHWFGVDLTASDAVVNNLRRQRIPWAGVQAVTRESRMGVQSVALWTVGGERIRLAAPSANFLRLDLSARDFEQRFHIIGQWWLEHRGEEWMGGDIPGSAR
jgi:hypothetical protein